MALADRRQWDEAEEDFRAAAEIAATERYPYAEGRSLAEWGRMLLATGAPDRAARHLEGALDIFRRLGAWGDAVTSHAALQEMGQA
jgi:tetratricopeptide (TPR) repeat protein